MSQQPTERNQQDICHKNEQNRINNRHAGTTNKTGLTTDMLEQQTKQNQHQTCQNDKQNRIGNIHAGTTNRTE
jgi:hypothetical protein